MDDCGARAVPQAAHLIHPLTEIRIFHIHKITFVKSSQLSKQLCADDEKTALGKGNRKRLPIIHILHRMVKLSLVKMGGKKHTDGHIENG